MFCDFLYIFYQPISINSISIYLFFNFQFHFLISDTLLLISCFVQLFKMKAFKTYTRVQIEDSCVTSTSHIKG